MSESKSLVALAEQTVKIETALAENEGELSPEIEAMLAEVDVKLPEKVENYALLMERMDALSKYYDDRAALMNKMSKAASTLIERCEANLKLAMTKLNVEEIKGVDARFTLKDTAGRVVIENDANLDPAYTTIETQVVTKIDKKRIAEDLKLGVPVRGARLEIGKSLRKYANTPGRK